MPPRPDVEFFYAAVDAYVSPSIEDAFALPPAEAMACGLPVITSDLGAFAEVLNDPEQTFRTGDVEALAGQLVRVLDDPSLADRWARNGRKRALETLTERRMIEGHDLVYREVLESKGAIVSARVAT